MKKEIEHKLENQDNWDYEHLETRAPIKAPRVVVSVAFRHEDFKTVSEYAERLGKRVSEFIREAALEKAGGRDSAAFIYGSGNAGVLWSVNELPSITLLNALTKETHESPGMSG